MESWQTEKWEIGEKRLRTHVLERYTYEQRVLLHLNLICICQAAEHKNYKKNCIKELIWNSVPHEIKKITI